MAPAAALRTSRGVDVATVAKFTGTRVVSVAMIEPTYRHLVDEHLQGAAARLAKGRKQAAKG
jgi:hypothetical protein